MDSPEYACEIERVAPSVPSSTRVRESGRSSHSSYPGWSLGPAGSINPKISLCYPLTSADMLVTPLCKCERVQLLPTAEVSKGHRVPTSLGNRWASHLASL